MSQSQNSICAYHPGKKAAHLCHKCGKPICFNCVSVWQGNYVCEECDPDFAGQAGEKDAQPPRKEAEKSSIQGWFAAILKNPKFAKWILAFSLILFVGTFFFVYSIVKNPPHGKLSIYRIAYYPVKSEGKTITKLLEEKKIPAEWKSLENKLTPDGGFFVYFQNSKAENSTPLWYVKDQTPYTINKTSRSFCNSEIPEATIFSVQGITEAEIFQYVYGQKGKK